jgi:hypothetical protein
MQSPIRPPLRCPMRALTERHGQGAMDDPVPDGKSALSLGNGLRYAARMAR